MNKRKPMPEINAGSTAAEMTPGGLIYGAGNSIEFKTGAWSSILPVWDSGKCKQCMLCYPVCPDSSIPAREGRRLDFNLEYCKGCGICARVCPFGAIAMREKGGTEE